MTSTTDGSTPLPRRSSRTRRAVVASIVALSCLGLAACGSQVDPQTVAAAQGAGNFVDSGSGAVAADGLSGTASGAAPGTPGGSGALPGASSDSGGDSAAGSEGGTSAQGGDGAASATGGTKAGSCDGFENQTGITDDSIVISNVSDISGPFPGLFKSAQDAVKAYVTFFNSSSDICGRELELLALDSRTDAAADQQAYARACDSAFAVVGSVSAFDSGGAATAEDCGLPDLRSVGITPERIACITCFAALSGKANEFQNSIPDYYLENYREASQEAAYLYADAGGAKDAADAQVGVMEQRGMKFLYVNAIDAAEFNYAPYVQELKDRGVQWVQFLGAYQQAVRLAQTMQQQGYQPDVYLLDPTAYERGYIEQGGDAVEGTHIFLNAVPFEEASSSPEVTQYLQWLQRTDPSADPTLYGLFAWSAARLFVQEAVALGGDLSRESLVARIAKVDNWTANGMHSPQHVGAERLGDCARFIKVQGGKWVPEGPTKYMCAGVGTA